MGIAVAAVAGLAAGHALRRTSAWLAGVKSDGMPFKLPWLEILAAAAAAGVALVLGHRPAWYLFAALLVAITATDFHVKLIPNRITYPGAVLGLAWSMVAPTEIHGFLGQGAWVGLDADLVGGLALGALGAVTGFGILELFRRAVGAMVGMEVLGMGDSKLLLMMGAFLGPKMIVVSLVPALAAGIVLGVAYTKLTGTPHLPFGPALALGGYVTRLWGAEIRDTWVGLIGATRTMSPRAAALMSLVLLAVAIMLLLRVRRRREEYTRQIEEEYDRLEERD